MSETITPQVTKVNQVFSTEQEIVTLNQIAHTNTSSIPEKDSKVAQAKDTNENLKKLTEKYAKPLGDMSLKFKINEETHDVTVIIIDNSSKEVVRTIPPEEMAKINAGELLQLFA